MSALAQRLDETVSSAKFTRPETRRDNGGKHGNFLQWIYLQVHLRSLNIFVAQPQCNLPYVTCRLEEVERTGVSQHMRGDAFLLQALALFCGGAHVLFQDGLEASAR